MNKVEKIHELIEILQDASKKYYQEDTEIMSNFEYDKLYDELLMLEEDTGIVFAESPTQKVGYEILSNLEKIKHSYPMLSLDKTKEVTKLEEFLYDKEGLLSWKLDGLTIVLTYENGVLIQAVTRGNGEIGEDITHNAKVFKNIPISIKYKSRLTIRGEAVISYKDFEKINESIEENKYKNPRNLSSGTVRQLNNEVVAQRNIRFLAFSLIGVEDIDFENLKSNQLDWLVELGFQIPHYEIVNKDNVVEEIKEFESKMKNNEYASDGLVLTYNEIEYSLSLGATSKFPKDSIAFKWEDECKETNLLSIEWNTSRTGLINPVAIFEPLELEGTTVNRASLHNLSIIENLSLGIGDTVTVYKANMIIPQILNNLTRSNNLDIPKHCPSCNEETKIIKQKDAKVLMCCNEECSARKISFLIYFSGRDAMNVEGFSEATAKLFYEMDFVKNYLDIFSLHKYKEELEKLEGFGKKSIEKLLKNIEKAKNVQLSNFIYSLGIEQVGLSNARLLSRHFDYNTEKIINATEEELKTIEGFGEIISKNIVDYFNDERNITMFKDALDILNIEEVELESINESPINGLTFVITGSINHFKNRKELQKEIERLGGKATTSVSKNTSYLINNDLESSSSKNKKAKELKVSIITEEEFLKLIEGRVEN